MKTTVKLLIIMATIGTVAGCKTTRQAEAGNQPATPAATVETTQPATPAATVEKTMPEGRLTEVKYIFQGMAWASIENPRLTRSEGKPMLYFNSYGRDMQTEVSDSLFDAARDIIEQERMYAYDSYYTSGIPGPILDGYRWEFSATFVHDDGTKERLSSSGRNGSPKGSGLERINRLLSGPAADYLKQLETKQ